MGSSKMTENNKLDKNPVISIDYRIKLLYAIGITMVVLAHCRGGGVVLLFDWFPYGGLHVALFIFCSGYLYKDSSEDHIKPYVFKKIKRLIIPLYLYLDTLCYCRNDFPAPCSKGPGQDR